jgi:hypothetical protein
MAMTELPEPPAHEGLTFQEWNWTLKEIQADEGIVDVGATYITDDGKTRLYIVIERDVQRTVSVGVHSVSTGTVYVDWGDGTGVEEVQLTTDSKIDNRPYAKFSHTYETIGSYVIKLDATTTVALGYSNSVTVLGRGYSGSGNYLFTDILKKVELGGKVNYLCVKAFCGYRKLKSIILPKGTSYYDFAGSTSEYFFNTGIECIVIPRAAGGMIRHGAMGSCQELRIVSLPRNFGGSAIITEKLLKGCKSLRSLAIPGSVYRIEAGALQETGIEKLVLGAGITSVGSNAFSSLSNLKTFVSKEKIGTFESSFNGCERLETIAYPGKSLPNNAFNNCKMLKNVQLRDDLTSIGSYAFYYCFSLESIEIPASVASIGANAFYNCQGLVEIQIPDGVTSIQDNTFCQCYNIREIEIPASVTTIGKQAFQYCSSLRYIDFSKHTSVPTLSATSAFSYVRSDVEIRVPAALYDSWIAATNWSNSSIVSKIVAV